MEENELPESIHFLVGFCEPDKGVAEKHPEGMAEYSLRF